MNSDLEQRQENKKASEEIFRGFFVMKIRRRRLPT